MLWRLFDIQILKKSDLRSEFLAQVQSKQSGNFIRGNIFTHDKYGKKIPLALNKDRFEIYAVPHDVVNPESLLFRIDKILNLSSQEKEALAKKLSHPDDFYEKITEVDLAKDRDAFIKPDIKGLYSREVIDRYYPQQDLASQVVGFFGEDQGGRRGLYGIEKQYNEDLSQGKDINLTVDFNLQKFIEDDIKALLQERQATRASAMVLDAKTGAITAMASTPSFNPNDYPKVKDLSQFMNPFVENQYEFGSVIKPVVYVAGLEEKVVTPDTTYYDAGTVTADGFTIRNFNNERYGTITLRQALDFSVNTGAIFIGNRLGLDRLKSYLKKFGFGSLTGIDLPNEVAGDLSQLDKPYAKQAHLDTASFGQGISVTAMQLANAYIAIANRGAMIQPYIVANDESSGEGMFKGKIISTEAAQTIAEMMQGVANDGYGKNAKLPHYSLAVKTGTAQISVNGKYSEDTLQSIGGFFPASNPRFVVFVILEKPAIGLSASATVTHIMKNILQFLANYYEIPPDEK